MLLGEWANIGLYQHRSMRMKYQKIFKVVAFLLPVLLTAFSLPALASNGITKPQWVEGELIVKFKPSASKADAATFLKSLDLKVLRQFKLVDARHLKLPDYLTVSAALQVLTASPLIEYAEPNHLYYKNVIPNDTLFNNLWGANNTDAVILQ